MGFHCRLVGIEGVSPDLDMYRIDDDNLHMGVISFLADRPDIAVGISRMLLYVLRVASYHCIVFDKSDIDEYFLVYSDFWILFLVSGN